LNYTRVQRRIITERGGLLPGVGG